MTRKPRIRVCGSKQLDENNHVRVDVFYAGQLSSVLVFRYQGDCIAYRNLCVHMPRGLDCENDMIFDSNRQLLRCSMHGIVYDPLTGASVSTMCTGEKLTAVKVQEDEDGVWIIDKRVMPLAISPD